jgi:hypothetical protein
VATGAVVVVGLAAGGAVTGGAVTGGVVAMVSVDGAVAGSDAPVEGGVVTAVSEPEPGRWSARARKSPAATTATMNSQSIAL